MPGYDPGQEIINASLDELRVIGLWADHRAPRHPRQKIVLIGGWAVHSYNNYFGSVDIDLVASSAVKASLMNYLRRERGFTHSGEEGCRSVSKATPSGEIVIDFLSDESDNRFRGRDEVLGFDRLQGRTVTRIIDGDLRFAVPERTLLLLYKLKASWDRTYTVAHEAPRNPEYLRGKIVKDGSDVLALIDPRNGGHELDINFLGFELDRLGFLKGHFRAIPDQIEVVRKYAPRMDLRAAHSACDEILSRI